MSKPFESYNQAERDRFLASLDGEPQREPGEDDDKESPPVQPEYIEFAPAFLGINDPPLKYLINELLPEGVLALAHGEPRTRKSWFAIEVAIALACGHPAFGLERLGVAEPMPVLYSSQEDGSRAVRERVKRLLMGYGLPYPPLLAFAVHKGISLDSAEWQGKLIDDIKKHGFKLLILDPIRRYSDNVDKGPTEVQKITKFLREVAVKTGCTPWINHHDVKPPGNGNQDTRRRSQKASGGDWFASCECPISLEPAGENTSLVSPEDYKFSKDPQPFTFTIQEDESRSWARLSGEDTTADNAASLVHNDKILLYLTTNPYSSTDAIRKGCKIGRDITADSLEKMMESGSVDRTVGGIGKATKWFVRSAQS